MESPKVLLKKRKLKGDHGQAYYEREKDPESGLKTGEVYDIKIVVDPRNAKLVSLVVHELLHVYLAINHRFDLKFVPGLEEVMVKGLEDELSLTLDQPGNGKLLESWLHAIERKLQ